MYAAKGLGPVDLQPLPAGAGNIFYMKKRSMHTMIGPGVSNGLSLSVVVDLASLLVSNIYLMYQLGPI